MAVKLRGKRWCIVFAPFGTPTKLAISADGKKVAEAFEHDILKAIRANDYSQLTIDEREACIRLFTNQGREVPPSLSGIDPNRLTLWEAQKIFKDDPEIKNAPKMRRDRYEQCLFHVIDHFGKSKPIDDIWIPELKDFQIKMQGKGLSNGTINWQFCTLSKMFTILQQHRLVTQNPVRLTSKLSTRESQRHVYIAFVDVKRIADAAPDWYRPIIWIAYYTGMRRGEILPLTWKCVDFDERIIYIGAGSTKERLKKRVPMRFELVELLKSLRGVGNRPVFTVNGQPLGKDSTKKAWDRTVKKMDFESKPNFHDLRHTFSTNARRSGLDPLIRERIMGHQDKTLGVSMRYGVLSNDELVREIDKLTFDHGSTKIWVERGKNEPKTSQKTKALVGARAVSY